MDVQLTVVIPASLHAQADSLARRLGLTRSALHTEALADFLDLHDEPGGAPEEAEEDADGAF